MAEISNIEWTDATWNPWYGCHKVSQGCKHCYMFREMGFYGRDPNTVTRSKTKFDDPLKWARNSKLPSGSKIFTCSWSDWFIEEADPWRQEAWDIIKRTPSYTYQILTKRPERILANLPADWGAGYPNVWLGVSVENQEAAYKRIPLLLKIPTAVRFLSCEPLLGPLEISIFLYSGYTEPPYDDIVNWVIVGGESGQNARPMHPDWARSIRDQCQAGGVSFLFKQWGEYYPTANFHSFTYYLNKARNRDFDRLIAADGFESQRSNDYERATYPLAGVKRVGKKAAGRLLDGREWNEFPAAERAGASLG